MTTLWPESIKIYVSTVVLSSLLLEYELKESFLKGAKCEQKSMNMAGVWILFYSQARVLFYAIKCWRNTFYDALLTFYSNSFIYYHRSRCFLKYYTRSLHDLD